MRSRLVTLVCAVVFAALPARADEPLALEWEAPPSCPTETHARAEILRIAGTPTPAARRVAARAKIKRMARNRWHVALRMRTNDASDAREFEAESCGAATDAVALIIALALNPRATPPSATTPPLAPTVPAPPPASAAPLAPAAPPAPAVPTAPTAPPAPAAPAAPLAPLAPAAPPAPAAPSAPAPAAPPAPTPSATSNSLGTSTRRPRSPAPPSPRGFPLAVSLAATVDSASLPSLGVGGEFALSWVPSRVRLEVAATYWAPQTATVSGPTREGADFTLYGAAARGAFVWRAGPFELGPLAGPRVERIGAAGFGGVASSFDQSQLVPSIDAAMLAMWSPAAHVALRAVAGVAVPLTRPSFVVTQPSPAPPLLVHRAASISARAALAIEVRFF